MKTDNLTRTLNSMNYDVTAIVEYTEMLVVLISDPAAGSGLNGIQMVLLQIGERANSIQRQLNAAQEAK